MEVIIGIQARDGSLRVQLDDDKVDALRTQLEESLKGGGGVIWVTDKDGREYGLSADKIAYVEFGTEKSSRQVGFSAS
jgi:hypothetical protein